MKNDSNYEIFLENMQRFVLSDGFKTAKEAFTLPGHIANTAIIIEQEKLLRESSEALTIQGDLPDAFKRSDKAEIELVMLALMQKIFYSEAFAEQCKVLPNNEFRAFLIAANDEYRRLMHEE